jgi:CubicO group peptidase (beta-lactamase class C family)
LRFVTSDLLRAPGAIGRRRFLKQAGIGAAALGLVLPGLGVLAGESGIRKRLARSTPEEQGISSEGILAFLEAVAASKHEFHSFMLVRRGHVVAEGWWHPYRAQAPHMLYSLSKSFTSTGIGFAVAEKRLSVQDKVISFFPEDLPPEVSATLDELRVKHLLSMSVGHAQDSTGTLWGKENWVKQFLSLPIPHEPGSAFLYDSGATYMLSGIVQKATGMRLLDYLKPRLFEPLGITEMTWETCPRGINTGGWGLKLRTESLAKFGQLYLQKGMWDGKQLLPENWVAEATSFKIQQPSPDLEHAKQKSDWLQGYCYQFWRCRHNAFRGDGAFGQFTVVMPEQEAVLAITSESSNMQGELDLVWEHLLPAMKQGALPKNRSAHERLEARLRSLELAPPKSQPMHALAERISGKPFKIESNDGSVENVVFTFHRDSCGFKLKDDKGVYTVDCGFGKWKDGETAMPGTPPKLTQGKLPAVSKVAAAAAWQDDHSLRMIWRFYETPHHDTVTCTFGEDNVEIEFLDSIAAMSPGRKDKRPALRGTMRRS